MAAARFRTIGMPALLLMLVLTLAAPVGILAQAPAVDPDADKLLARMTDYLGSLERFSLDADNMIEEVLVTGQKIQYDFSTSVVIQRPNRLRAVRDGDQLKQFIVYDGKTLTVHNLNDNYYASTDAPDNLDDLLHFARDTLDIVPPTGDMVFTNAYELLSGSLTEGFVVGKSMVGGVRCDHLAFRNPLVDWQVWIADGDKPLPYKYVLTTRDDTMYPQYMVLFSNWNVAPKVKDSMFEFVPPEDAKEIEFVRMEADDSAQN